MDDREGNIPDTEKRLTPMLQRLLDDMREGGLPPGFDPSNEEEWEEHTPPLHYYQHVEDQPMSQDRNTIKVEFEIIFKPTLSTDWKMETISKILSGVNVAIMGDNSIEKINTTISLPEIKNAKDEPPSED